MTSSAWSGLVVGIVVGVAGMAGIAGAWSLTSPPAVGAPLRKKLPPPMPPPILPVTPVAE